MASALPPASIDRVSFFAGDAGITRKIISSFSPETVLLQREFRPTNVYMARPCTNVPDATASALYYYLYGYLPDAELADNTRSRDPSDVVLEERDAYRESVDALVDAVSIHIYRKLREYNLDEIDYDDLPIKFPNGLLLPDLSAHTAFSRLARGNLPNNILETIDFVAYCLSYESGFSHNQFEKNDQGTYMKSGSGTSMRNKGCIIPVISKSFIEERALYAYYPPWINHPLLTTSESKMPLYAIENQMWRNGQNWKPVVYNVRDRRSENENIRDIEASFVSINMTSKEVQDEREWPELRSVVSYHGYSSYEEFLRDFEVVRHEKETLENVSNVGYCCLQITYEGVGGPPKIKTNFIQNFYDSSPEDTLPWKFEVHQVTPQESDAHEWAELNAQKMSNNSIQDLKTRGIFLNDNPDNDEINLVFERMFFTPANLKYTITQKNKNVYEFTSEDDSGTGQSFLDFFNDDNDERRKKITTSASQVLLDFLFNSNNQKIPSYPGDQFNEIVWKQGDEKAQISGLYQVYYASQLPVFLSYVTPNHFTPRNQDVKIHLDNMNAAQILSALGFAKLTKTKKREHSILLRNGIDLTHDNKGSTLTLSPRKNVFYEHIARVTNKNLIKNHLNKEELLLRMKLLEDQDPYFFDKYMLYVPRYEIKDDRTERGSYVSSRNSFEFIYKACDINPAKMKKNAQFTAQDDMTETAKQINDPSFDLKDVMTDLKQTMQKLTGFEDETIFYTLTNELWKMTTKLVTGFSEVSFFEDAKEQTIASQNCVDGSSYKIREDEKEQYLDCAELILFYGYACKTIEEKYFKKDDPTVVLIPIPKSVCALQKKIFSPAYFKSEGIESYKPFVEVIPTILPHTSFPVPKRALCGMETSKVEKAQSIKDESNLSFERFLRYLDYGSIFFDRNHGTCSFKYHNENSPNEPTIVNQAVLRPHQNSSVVWERLIERGFDPKQHRITKVKRTYVKPFTLNNSIETPKTKRKQQPLAPVIILAGTNIQNPAQRAPCFTSVMPVDRLFENYAGSLDLKKNSQ